MQPSSLIYISPVLLFAFKTSVFSQQFRYMADITVSLTNAECKYMVTASRSAFCFAMFGDDDFSGKVMVFDKKLNNEWCCLIKDSGTVNAVLNGGFSMYYSVDVTVQILDGKE